VKAKIIIENPSTRQQTTLCKTELFSLLTQPFSADSIGSTGFNPHLPSNSRGEPFALTEERDHNQDTDARRESSITEPVTRIVARDQFGAFLLRFSHREKILRSDKPE
jgi:hypothetical protein